MYVVAPYFQIVIWLACLITVLAGALLPATRIVINVHGKGSIAGEKEIALVSILQDLLVIT